MSVETEAVPQANESMKRAWEEIASRRPDGCKMYLYFEAHYAMNDLVGKPWEYAGEKWKVSLAEELGCAQTTYATGEGKTPTDAMDAALSDLCSKHAHVKRRELAEFKEWRAARERAGKHTPCDREGWDRATSDQADEDEKD